jgi:hypothetical protein
MLTDRPQLYSYPAPFSFPALYHHGFAALASKIVAETLTLIFTFQSNWIKCGAKQHKF